MFLIENPVLILILKIAGVQILFHIRLGTDLVYNKIIQVRNSPPTHTNELLNIKNQPKVI